jgi:methionyl-tRNA formyltransferase
VRTVFLGSAPFATPILERLIAGHHRPICVVTQPDRRQGRGRKQARSPIAALAEAAGIELLQPLKATDPQFQDRLRELEPDVFFIVAYGKILREELLAIPRVISLNVHPSLLPRYRGASPIQSALLAGEQVTGVTIQQVSMELDAGDILLAEQTRIEDDEDAGALGVRLASLSADLSERALDLVAEGQAVYSPQDAAEATFCTKLDKSDGLIDWSQDAAHLRRLVRGVTPWPGARTTMPDGTDLTVVRTTLIESPEGPGSPGMVLGTPGCFAVACGEGALRLEQVKPAGKESMSGAEFLRGARLKPGTVLGDQA